MSASEKPRAKVEKAGWTAVGTVSSDGGGMTQVGVKGDGDVTVRTTIRIHGGDSATGVTMHPDRARELRRILGVAIGDVDSEEG